MPKDWCFWIWCWWRLLRVPWTARRLKPVSPKGNQFLIFIGRTDAEAEAPTLWPPNAKSQLTGKDPDAGKDRRQEDKRMTEDELVRLYHRLNGHDFEQALEDGEGQGSLVCCSSWGHKKSDMTEWLKNTYPWSQSAHIHCQQNPCQTVVAVDLLIYGVHLWLHTICPRL